MNVDAATTGIPGPWKHRLVAAGTGRFHVAVAGHEDAPLIVLLHGFPQFWWTWRGQIPPLAAAGYRVAAMDLRGTGMSDKGPTGYDGNSLARDVAGVIRTLGATEAIIIGQGVGGVIAWSMPALQPSVTRAIAVLGAANPLTSHARSWQLHTGAAKRFMAFAQMPWLPERRLRQGALVRRILAEWGAPGWCPPEVAEQYINAMRIPFAAHSAMEILRWLVRSTWRADGARYLTALREAPAVPTLQLHGERDGVLRIEHAFAPQADHHVTIPDAGHFLSEESPDAVTGHLVKWLASL